MTVLVVSPHGALNQPWRIIWGLKRPGALRKSSPGLVPCSAGSANEGAGETHSVMPVEDDDGSSSALEALNCTGPCPCHSSYEFTAELIHVGTAHSVTAFSLPRFVQDFGVGPKQFDPTTPEGEHQERYVDLGMGIEMGDGGQQEVHWGVGQEIEQRVEYEVDQDMEIDEQDECHEKRE